MVDLLLLHTKRGSLGSSSTDKCDESHESMWHRTAGESDRSSPAMLALSRQRDNAVITASQKGTRKKRQKSKD